MTCAIGAAYGADVTDLGTVGTTGAQGPGGSGSAPESKAAAVAPTQAGLEITQPQSIIRRSFFEGSKPLSSDYTGIAALAPSVSGGISANGPGLGEAKNGLRGFPDGQYNITYDGIPFGDTNGPTHHSTAYFPAEVIGGVVVERGPGNASNIGQATFGGSINLYSRELSNERVFSPYLAVGSWNTVLTGAHFESGTLGELRDTKFSINAQRLSSDGYRTHSGVAGENYSLKVQTPFGDSTVVTVNLNRNDNWYLQSDNDKGLTLAQVDKYGKNYALSEDPNRANFYGYNHTNKTTSFNYVRVQSELGPVWSIDDTLYYYNYTNNTISSSASASTVADAGLSSVKNAAGATIANQMAGYQKINEYAVNGNLFKATAKLGSGLVRLGLWSEVADTHRARFELNLSGPAGTPNYSQAAVPGVYKGINNVTYEQGSGWHTYQPFAEYEWRATDKLSITPGLKYMLTQLRVDALVNQTARVQQHLAADYSKLLPFLTANYKVDRNWSVYGQYAQGMLVPDISSYQSTNAASTSIAPQTSTNYQAGVVHQSDRLAFDADVYYIDFNNKIAQVPGTSAQPIFYNQGGVIYKGIEGQATYALSNSFSLYGNASLNSAASKTTGLQIANTPRSTAAAGLLFRQAAWSSSLIHKRVGAYYALDDQGYRMNSYSTTDLSVGYTHNMPGSVVRKLRLQVGVYNLFNKKDAIAVTPANNTAGTATYGQASATDTFLFQPGRSFMASVRADI